ncbi:unnamed protein product [Trichobilharzia regenti]|nr:unnamed protein product [Trichobilharzia regenti]
MRKCHTLLEQYLSNSIQQPETATQGCLTLWHMCLPLIQHDVQTRLKTTKSLQLIIDYLTKQDSLHFRLRCQLHMTMAYCQADMEQITQAIDNIEKLDPVTLGRYWTSHRCQHSLSKSLSCTVRLRLLHTAAAVAIRSTKPELCIEKEHIQTLFLPWSNLDW